MARNIYGASGAAQVVSLAGTPTLAAATVKTARTGGTTVTDILNMAGANVAGVVTPDSRGQIIFQGPDNVTTTFWLDFGDGGPRWAVTPVDFTSLVTSSIIARELAQNTAPGSATPKSAIPYVNDTAFENMALALDPMVVPRFATQGARDTAFPAPADGDRCYRTDLHAFQTYRAMTTARWVTDMALINETTLGADTAIITFNNIPADWRHLLIKFRARATGSAAANIVAQPVGIRFNNDSGNNYACAGYIRNMRATADAQPTTTRLYESGNNGTAPGLAGSTAATFGQPNGGLTNYSNGLQSSAHVGVCAGSSLTTLQGGGEIKIDDYSQASTRKVIQGDTGFTDNSGWVASTTGYSTFSKLQGGWQNNSAITRVDLLPVSATAFVAGSRFSLYGLS